MKIALTFFAALLAGVLGACATVGAPAVPATPAQIAAQVCPDVQIVTAAFAATPGALAPTDAAHLAAIQPYITRVCSVGAFPSAPDLHTLSVEAVPVMIDAVNGSSLPEADKTRLVLTVNLAKALISQQLAEQAPAASAAK